MTNPSDLRWLRAKIAAASLAVAFASLWVAWALTTPPPLVGTGVFVPTSVSMLSLYNVRAYGATGNGTTDDTAAIQAALTAAAPTGSDCYAPPGNYLVAGQLTIPGGVTFVGSYPTTPMVGGIPPAGGSQLWITGNAGNAGAAPAISMGQTQVSGQSVMGAMRGFIILYPNQVASATTPVAYPWTIAMASTTAAEATCTIEDIHLVNPYQGILISNVTRPNVRRVYGQPLSIGISVQGCTDICRLDDIHFVYLWAPPGSNILTWQQANGIAFQFGRSDEQICRGLFALAYNVGVQFFNQTTGSNTGTTYGTFTECSLDTCNVGIQATAVGGTSGDGVTWIGGGIEPNTTAVSLAAGPLHFVGVRFFSGGTPAITQTGGDLAFDACRFQSAFPATSSGSTFVFTDNLLKSTGSTITLSGTGKATLVGNTLTGAAFSSLISGTMSGGTVQGSNN